MIFTRTVKLFFFPGALVLIGDESFCPAAVWVLSRNAFYFLDYKYKYFYLIFGRKKWSKNHIALKFPSMISISGDCNCSTFYGYYSMYLVQ